MWGAVLVFALLAMGEPVRIGAAVLLISRPRPMFNLFLFWVGGVLTTIIVGLATLFLLRDLIHAVTASAAAATSNIDLASIQIAVGCLILLAVPVLIVRRSSRQAVPATVGASDWPGTAVDGGASSVLSRVSIRAQNVLQSGSPWWALFVGAWLGPGPPVELVAALTAIVASGAAAGTQVGAIVVFTLVMFTFAEIPLIGHLIAPARTEAIMSNLQTWMRVHRRRVFAIGFAVLGAYLVTTGLNAG